MYLYINTANGNDIVLALLDKQGKILKFKKISAQYKQSEKLLVNIDKIVDKNLKKLLGVIVVKGPGSFTALRIGLTTANTMAWGLNLPIVGLMLDEKINEKELIMKGYNKIKKMKKFKAVMPEYGMEPNITVKKHK